MDPEFQRALTVVLGAGSIIMGIATIVLAFVFRSFGAKPRLGLMSALVAFLLVCSVLLFVLSYAAR
ncbi:MAG TPA: hypothetical protein VFP80_17075 [Thermoanaerobaculia bacterium]|nr:hypothetical protein [Thermoanaerobaculia bacterium]